MVVFPTMLQATPKINESMISWRCRYDSTYGQFLASITDVRPSTSCIVVGPKSGEHEASFVRRCMPDVHHLIAIESDLGYCRQLHQVLGAVLPDVDCHIVEDRWSNWSGPVERADAVLMLEMLNVLSVDERLALFRLCFERWLKPNGWLIVEVDDAGSIYAKVRQKINPQNTDVLTWTCLEAELEQLGYWVERVVRHKFTINLAGLDDDFIQTFANYHNASTVDVAMIRRFLQEIGLYAMCVTNVLIVRPTMPSMNHEIRAVPPFGDGLYND